MVFYKNKSNFQYYTWDEKDRLIATSDQNADVEYLYGEDNQRAVKSSDEGALFNRNVVLADYKLAAYNFVNMMPLFNNNRIDRLRSYATFEAFMLLGTLKFLFIPGNTSESMTVGGIYARH